MKVWWCEEHQTSGWGGGRAQFCHLHPFVDEVEPENYECRMVEMQLVPADARVGEKVAEALDADHSWYRCTGNHDYRAIALVVLGALAEEPPKDPWDYDP